MTSYWPTGPRVSTAYWQALGGMPSSHFFNRTYNVGLEPTTAYPAGSIPDAQRANRTMKTLDPGETLSIEFEAHTYHGLEAVSNVEGDGTVCGPEC